MLCLINNQEDFFPNSTTFYTILVFILMESEMFPKLMVVWLDFSCVWLFTAHIKHRKKEKVNFVSEKSLMFGNSHISKF